MRRNHHNQWRPMSDKNANTFSGKVDSSNPSPPSPRRAPLKLRSVREMFRVVGEIRELGADPNRWRPHMIRRVSQLVGAQIVVSSEIHFRAIGKSGLYRVHDIGWGCDQEGNTWQINTEREETPEAYWLAVLGKNDPAKDDSGQIVAVKPTRAVYGGTSFILSQYPLPHLGAVDQLG